MRSQARKLAHKVYGQCGNLPVMGGSRTNITTSITNIDRSKTSIHNNYNSSTTTNTYNNTQKQPTVPSPTPEPTTAALTPEPTAATIATTNAYEPSHPTYSSATNGINDINGICEFNNSIAGIKHLWCYVIYNTNGKFQFCDNWLFRLWFNIALDIRFLFFFFCTLCRNYCIPFRLCMCT